MNRECRQMGATAKRIGFGLNSTALACGSRSRPEGLRWGKLSRLWRRRAQTARFIMAGVPDYEVYIAHRRAHHPVETIISYPEFFRERQQARYACERGYFGGCC